MVLCTELFKHEVLGQDLINKEHIQDPNYPCLNLNDDVSEQTAIQELEHLVDEAHLHTTDSNISKIIQYHDSEVSLIFSASLHISWSISFVQISEYQIQQLEQNLNGNVSDNPKEMMSLSDITLYTFDSISDASPASVSTKMLFFQLPRFVIAISSESR